MRVDNNHNLTFMGVSDLDGVTPVQIKVDPITGYLLCQLSTAGATLGSSPSPKIDSNHAGVALAEASDGSGLRPLLIDPTTGYLLYDFL